MLPMSHKRISAGSTLEEVPLSLEERHTPFLIDTHHPILKNAIYEAPLKCGENKEVKEKDLANEDSYFSNIETLHLNEKYKAITLELKRRKKSLEKKLLKIEEDKNEATEKLKYKEYADYLLTILDEVSRGDEYFIYEDKKISLNTSFSPSQNLERFYKIIHTYIYTAKSANTNFFCKKLLEWVYFYT